MVRTSAYKETLLKLCDPDSSTYDVLYQWTQPMGKQVIMAPRISFTPDSAPVVLHYSKQFKSDQCENGFSLSSLNFNEVGSSTLFVNVRPKANVEVYTISFELLYLVSSLYGTWKS
ncbi:hypothetical protein FRC02_006187 [Tulasnella sp. 418]|nr:hypothetical protein FRC02_006187 [Tulasnella sp. 418]